MMNDGWGMGWGMGGFGGIGVLLVVLVVAYMLNLMASFAALKSDSRFSATVRKVSDN